MALHQRHHANRHQQMSHSPQRLSELNSLRPFLRFLAISAASPEPKSTKVAGSGTGAICPWSARISTAKFPLSVLQSPVFVQVWKTPPVRSENPSERSDEIGGPGLTANGT